ncbi:hypothetical protein GMO_23280 [Gluconobacter morbifer G707]|uniref:Uncharacterized protein n=1 Tax=Gluconobacter morbifer G707 TaxID=1088869 RepID=G6XLS9_9PROT|nr:hypothetical protein GMO_23280 [Gluconobacter morbifer G707]
MRGHHVEIHDKARGCRLLLGKESGDFGSHDTHSQNQDSSGKVNPCECVAKRSNGPANSGTPESRRPEGQNA